MDASNKKAEPSQYENYSTSPVFWSYCFSKKDQEEMKKGDNPPNLNEVVAASMYESIKNNMQYILQTQYGEGIDKNGDAWGGVCTGATVAPVNPSRAPIQWKEKNLSPNYYK